MLNMRYILFLKHWLKKKKNHTPVKRKIQFFSRCSLMTIFKIMLKRHSDIIRSSEKICILIPSAFKRIHAWKFLENIWREKKKKKLFTAIFFPVGLYNNLASIIINRSIIHERKKYKTIKGKYRNCIIKKKKKNKNKTCTITEDRIFLLQPCVLYEGK